MTSDSILIRIERLDARAKYIERCIDIYPERMSELLRLLGMTLRDLERSREEFTVEKNKEWAKSCEK